jgi:uncharacterized protein with ParB-like and HNH nuclease domain
MKIACLDKEIGKLLGEAFYKIPRFQRPYSWDHTNLEEFWNDTIVDNDSDYFIGNFVFYQDGDALGVVDGQQRLTTVTTMLCALRDLMQEEGLRDLAKGIHLLIERPNIKNEKYYVLRPETSYPFFQEYIQRFGKRAKVPNAGPEEDLLKEAYYFFHGNFAQLVSSIKGQSNLSEPKKKARILEELSRIRDKILGLKVICTALDNDDDAYVIFETLNTRGKDLTLSDLVKSHLSRLLKPTNKGVDLAKDKWVKIAKTFEESQADLSVSTFIHHYWLSRYDYVTEKKLYKALRKQIRKENAAEFLDDLVQESEIYRLIHETSYKKWRKDDLDIRDSLTAMSLFRIKQQLPMVLAVMRHHTDGTLKPKRVKQILSAIEHFHFSFTAVASQRSSGGISFMYASAARNLHDSNSSAAKGRVLDGLRAKLKSKLPPFGEFEARFLELRYSAKFTKQKNLVRYILTKITQHNSSGVSVDAERMTVEHIAPENPTRPASLSDEQVASLGNLILVDSKLNNKLGNKNFADKKRILRNSRSWFDSIIGQASTWSPTEVEARAKALATQAYSDVWKL